MKNKKIKFTFHPSAAVFFLLILISSARLGAITLISALLHELGHIAAAKLTSAEIERITVYPFGADMRIRGGSSYLTDIIIALSGPLVNLLFFVIAVRLPLSTPAALCNLVLCAVNLLPVKGLDGGVILRSLLRLVFPVGTADILTHVSTVSVLFISWLFSVYLLFCESYEPSLFIIVCFLFFSVVRDQTSRS